MSRQTRVQVPSPYSWPATAVISEPMLTPNVAASYGIDPSMQTMGTSAPPGYWSSSGSPPLMPMKDFSGMNSYPPGGFLSYFKNPSIPAISSQTSHEPPEMKVGGNTCFADVLRRNARIRDRSTHTQLKRDLVEHIWNRFGN